MKKCLATLCFSLLFVATGFNNVFASGRGAQELVPPQSWVYDAITMLSLESGITNFSDQAPISIRELQLYLQEINYDSLSKAGKTQYNRLQNYFAEKDISFDSDIFSVGVDPEVNVEAFAKTNEELDWVYDRYQRKPLILVPLKLQANDYFTMKTDIILAENKGQMSHNDNYTNIPVAQDQIDVNFPHTGYFSAGFNFTETTALNFQIGMGQQSIGRSLLGSVIMSEYFTDASYANLEIYSPNLRYNMNVTQFNVDEYMYTHRFDVRPFKKFQFSVQESILVNAPLELRFLNPLTIYHGMSPWRDYEPDKDDSESHTCAYLAIKAAFVPSKYVRFYGLFAQDQFQTAYEKNNWPDNVTPDGLGGELGVESFIPYKDGFFHINLEGYYANPFLYIKENPNWSLLRTYSENIGDMAIFYEWVGSPFGPDTIAGEFNLGYEVPNKFSVTASYLFMARGEYSGFNIFTDSLDWGGQDRVADETFWVYPNVDYESFDSAKDKQALVTPSGTPEYVNRFSVRASYSPVQFLTVTVQPAYVYIANHNHKEDSVAQGFEFALSTNIKLKGFAK